MNAPGPCLWCGRIEPITASSAPSRAPDWVLFVPLSPPSLNDYVQNKGVQRWNYKKQRDRWVLALIDACAKLGYKTDPRKPTGRRRVVFTRVFSGRERERDYGNLVGGMKLVVDAMRVTYSFTLHQGKSKGKLRTVYGAGLLLDDTPALLDDVYLQERGEESGLRIEITDLVSLVPATLPDQEEVATP